MEKIEAEQFTKKHYQGLDQTTPLGFKPAEAGVRFGLFGFSYTQNHFDLYSYHISYPFMDGFIM